MICPSCQFENSDELESCERCGTTLGPAEDGYGAEAWHCTSCGARAVAEVNYCQQCGEATTPTAEWVVGACVNCGGAWHRSWQFCRTCGVARANALLDEGVALPVYFAEYAPPAQARPALAGKPLGDLSVCAQCGAELPAEVNYCNQCGARVGPAPAADDGPAPHAAREVPHSRRAPDNDSLAPAALALAPPPDQTTPQPPSRAAESAAGNDARQPTSRPVGYRRTKQRARRWRMAAATFLIFAILVFAFLIVSETQLQDVLQKLRALFPGLGFAR